MSRRSTFPLDLFKALEQNDTNRLKDLLSQGGDPNESYDSLTNISLLHMACEKRQIECIHILIEAGADIRKRDDFGMHPMMNAIISQYHDVAEILLSHDPYIVDIQDRYGKAPIHMAVESDSIETVELLVRYGCNIDCYSSSGTTPLMALCADTNLKNNKHIMDILLAEKPNLEMTDFQCRRTALQYAVIKKNVDAVEALLSAGANTNTIDMVGRTPITNVMWEHVKIYDGSKGIDPDVMMIIVMLIQSGADLNCNKMEYSNPLVTAAFLEAEPLIRFFLEYGCNPNVTCM
ncbi:hypothetical protein KUTeg_007412 [Tegillarca granosa]|uniref:Uncharacterized protein n=1 Tax=Tegillarca granosa TaxID=220873 RepID=A0ABQ9FD61_TEGGR|nr:hypothetical protein KUTeg_007412 [Tegillarca granosa]